jgi:outer membrane protein
MKKIVAILLAATGLLATSTRVEAQAKIGYISLQELYPSMPEYKKADTSMGEYQAALTQNFDDMKKEFNEMDSLLGSKDTLKYTKAQLEIRKRNLAEMYGKLQGWNQQAQQMIQQKQQELMGPIQKKALDAIQTVAKENGYTYVMDKGVLLVSPPAEDITPLVKKKLGLK